MYLTTYGITIGMNAGHVPRQVAPTGELRQCCAACKMTHHNGIERRMFHQLNILELAQLFIGWPGLLAAMRDDVKFLRKSWGTTSLSRRVTTFRETEFEGRGPLFTDLSTVDPLCRQDPRREGYVTRIMVGL